LWSLRRKGGYRRPTASNLFVIAISLGALNQVRQAAALSAIELGMGAQTTASLGNSGPAWIPWSLADCPFLALPCIFAIRYQQNIRNTTI
jgi:hypothetical protein